MSRSRSTGKATAKQQKKAAARKSSATTSPSVRRKTARLLGRAVLSPAPDIPEVTFNADAIMTYRGLLAALSTHCPQLTLGNNIIAEDNILINHDVAINFNGFSIISNEARTAARVIDVRSGTVTLFGRGKIFAMGKNSVAIRAFGAISNGVPGYTTVTVGEGISLFAPDSYGILISPNLGVAYGLTLNLAGQIFAHDGVCLSSGIRGYGTNAPVINIQNGASILADETSGVAIEAAGYGEWNIAAAKLRGAVGVATASGVLNFSQARVLSSSGECFRIMEHPDTMLEVDLDGGDYAAIERSIIAGTPQTIKKFSAKNCDFYSRVDAIPTDFTSTVKRKKVNLHSDVESYLSNLVSLSAPVSDHRESAFAQSTEPTPESTAAIDLPTSEEDPDDLAIAAAFAAAEISEPETVITIPHPRAAIVKAPQPQAEETPAAEKSTSPVEISTEKSTSPTEAPAEAPASPAEIPASNDEAETAIEAALQREIDALDAEEFNESETFPGELSPEESIAEALDLEVYSSAEPLPERSPKPQSPRKLKVPKLKRPKSHTKKVPALTSTPRISDKPIPFELAAEPVARPNDIPVLAPAPEPILPYTSEQDAARRALTDAIMDIRKLSAEDFDTGFSELEQAIQQAERLLSNPFASLSDICDAASTLLNAFDDLEECDDTSAMSDAELDELFYHGAVLQEMLKESHSEKPKAHKTHKKSHKLRALLPESTPSASADMPDLLQEIIKHQQELHNSPQLQVAPIPDNPNLAPDYSNLVAVLTRIAEMDLNSYTLASQENLLNSLSDAQDLLNNSHATQSAIDYLADQLSAEIVQLVPLRQSYNSTVRPYAALSAPAPLIGTALASTMIDEMAPATTWSLGVTMIDEMTPFAIDATTREKMLRAMQSKFYTIKASLGQPFVKLGKSLAAGFRAGVRAYKETLHASTR